MHPAGWGKCRPGPAELVIGWDTSRVSDGSVWLVSAGKGRMTLVRQLVAGAQDIQDSLPVASVQGSGSVLNVQSSLRCNSQKPWSVQATKA